MLTDNDKNHLENYWEHDILPKLNNLLESELTFIKSFSYDFYELGIKAESDTRRYSITLSLLDYCVTPVSNPHSDFFSKVWDKYNAGSFKDVSVMHLEEVVKAVCFNFYNEGIAKSKNNLLQIIVNSYDTDS